MILYLLRHADADTLAASDDERRLSEKGVAQAQDVARFCKKHDLLPALILGSPVRRAHETARIVSEHLGVEMLTARWIACGMSPETAVEELRAYREYPSIAMVGHEPDFSQLAAHLLGLPDNAQIRVRKASLICLDLPTVRAGAARLEFSIPCKLM